MTSVDSGSEGRKDEDDLAMLMHASAAGDRQAFAILYHRSSGKLCGICLRLMGNEPEAHDGATYAELAPREDVPLGTMKSWIRRSLQRLRGCLDR